MVAATRRSRYAVAVSLAVTIVALWLTLRGDHASRTGPPGDLSTTTAMTTMTTKQGRGPLRGRSTITSRDASIAGTVRDDAGATIAGAQVCARLRDSTMKLVCTQAGQSGHYLLEGVRAGRLDLWSSARTYRPELVAPMPVLAGGARTDGVDIVLHRGGAELHGQITDTTGHGIAGARVEVGSVRAMTDSTGHYSMWVAAGWALAHVTADGWAGAYRGGPAPGEMGAILVPGADLAGIVVDEAGQPVPDAAVVATHTDPNGWSIWSDADSTRTDDDGHFVLTGMTSGRFDITARTGHGSGLASARLGIGEAGDGLVITLRHGVEIIGHVVSTSGTPCASPAMWVKDARGHYLDTELDGSGAVHAGGLTPGAYELQAGCSNLISDPSERVVVGDSDVERTWRLAPGGTIRGRVSTTRGTPVVDADVRLEAASSNQRPGPTYSVTTNRDGAYEMEGFAPGDYKLTAKLSASSSSPVEIEAAVTLHGAETVTHDFVGDDSRLGSLRGRIVTRPHGWKRVSITLDHVPRADAPAGGPIVQPITVNVDDAGAFAGDGIPADHYKLTIWADDGRWPIDGMPETGLPVEIRGGDTTTLEVHAGVGTGTMQGRVVDATGAPLSNVLVMVSPEQGDRDEHFESDLRALTDSDGHFAIRDLSGDVYMVRATRRESADLVKRKVPVGSTLELTLPGTTALSIVAHRASGPLGDLQIILVASTDNQAAYAQTFPGSDGHVTLEDVAPGTYTVVAIADGSQAKTEVTIVAGQHETVELAVPDLIAVSGRVLDARTRKPIANLVMSIVSAETNAMSRTTFIEASHTTDRDGRFVLRGVPRMKVRLSAQGAAPTDTTGWADVIRDVTTGPAEVDLGDLLAVSDSVGAKGGCGCLVREQGGQALVYSVTAGGAAVEAGLRDDDVITAVDGIATTGDHAGLAELLIPGPVDTTVEITTKRGPTVTLVRGP